MAEVIDFNQENLKEKETTLMQDSNFCKSVLKEILKDSNNLTDILVFTKDSNNEIVLFHTGVDIRDRSYIIQLIQADIASELASTEEIIL